MLDYSSFRDLIYDRYSWSRLRNKVSRKMWVFRLFIICIQIEKKHDFWKQDYNVEECKNNSNVSLQFQFPLVLS